CLLRIFVIPSHIGIALNEFINKEFINKKVKEALYEDAPHDVSICAARSDIIECMQHMAVSNFCKQFHLDGPVNCLCGKVGPAYTMAVSGVDPEVAATEPVANMLWFLQMNLSAATFEFADYQEARAVERKVAVAAFDDVYSKEV
ncbi:hypothetical protein OBBRIDRAFT_808840, partial [Obba rivulosa]